MAVRERPPSSLGPVLLFLTQTDSDAGSTELTVGSVVSQRGAFFRRVSFLLSVFSS